MSPAGQGLAHSRAEPATCADQSPASRGGEGDGRPGSARRRRPTLECAGGVLAASQLRAGQGSAQGASTPPTQSAPQRQSRLQRTAGEGVARGTWTRGRGSKPSTCQPGPRARAGAASVALVLFLPTEGRLRSGCTSLRPCAGRCPRRTTPGRPSLRRAWPEDEAQGSARGSRPGTASGRETRPRGKRSGDLPPGHPPAEGTGHA